MSCECLGELAQQFSKQVDGNHHKANVYDRRGRGERSDSVGLPEEPFEEKGGIGAVAVRLPNGVAEDLYRDLSQIRSKELDGRVQKDST